MKVFDRADQATWFAIERVEGRPMSGVRVRSALKGMDGLMLEVSLDSGTRVPAHEHSHESFCYVLEGKIRLRVGDETFLAGPGDAFMHPRGVIHDAEALESCRWLEVKSPPEETW